MSHKIGIWIDHTRAVIVSTSAGATTATTLESKLGPHARYSKRAAYPTPNGPKDGGGENHYEERFGQHLNRYYDEIIGKLGQPDALLIFGPAEAKSQLEERLKRSRGPLECPILIETADKMTDPQIVAKVKEHYGLDRPRT
jgi:hypothetical protein